MYRFSQAEGKERPFTGASTRPVMGAMEELLGCIGGNDFEEPFYRLCRHLVRAEYCSAYIFPKRGLPKMPIFASAAQQVHRDIADAGMHYLLQDSADDVSIAQFRRSSRLTLHERHAQQVSSPSLRKAYFDRFDISSVVCLLGEIEDDLIYISFYMRPGMAGIDDATVGSVLQHANLLFQLSHRHDKLTTLQRWRSTLSDMAIGACSHEEARAVFREILVSRSRLSNREADICALTLVGYTMEAIGLICGITLNTVATHRKRGFAKLGISSAKELFGTIRSLTQDF